MGFLLGCILSAIVGGLLQFFNGKFRLSHTFFLTPL